MAIPEGKVFDLEKMELVDAPKKEEPTATETVENKEEPAKEEDSPDEVKATTEQETTSEENSEDKPTEEESTETKDKEEEKKEEPSEESIGVDDFIKEKYAEHGIQTEEDLDKRMSELLEISKKYDDLQKEVATLREGKPKFSSPQQEKAFEFLQEFDVTNMGEGMQTIARIVTMDIANADPKVVLEEQFIFDHPEFTRDEALRKFNRDYSKKHSIKEEDFDSPEAYKEELEDLRLSEKSAVAKAKEFLQKKQKEFKAEPKTQSTTEAPKESPVVTSNIEKAVSEVEKYMSDFDSIVYEPDEKDPKSNFTISLSKEQRKAVHQSLKSWVSNPINYNEKGELHGGKDLEKQSIQVAYALFGDDIAAKIYAHAYTQGESKRAEEIAKIKPTREAKTVVDKVKGVSEEKQQEQLIRQRQAERAQKARVY